MEYRPPERTDTLKLPSGRTLAWTIYGGPLYPADAATPPLKVIFYCHGFPGSRVEPTFLQPALLQRLHARCIAIDRPGMGLSDHDPTRRILDWPADVLAVADHLGIPSFFVLGVSGGAPYALACAARIPLVNAPETTEAKPVDEAPAPTGAAPTTTAAAGRLRGTAIVSGIYPVALGTEGMLRGVRTLLTAGAWLPRMITGAALDWEMGRAARHDDPTVFSNQVDHAMAHRPACERAAWANPRVRDAAVEGMREAYRQGSAGVATDLMLFHDWGFALDEIKGGRVQLWHGRQDQQAPFAMAEKAAALMPHAAAHFLDDGHLSTSVNHYEAVLEELLGEADGPKTG